MRRISLCLFLLLSIPVIAQQKQVQYNMNKEELMAKQKEIMNDIAETQHQLDAIKNDKKATMGQLRVLQNKLAQRQRLIATINDETESIDKDIKNSSKEVDGLTNKLQILKMRYAQSIRYAYESRSSYSMVAFLFSSNDFNDAMRRMKYLKTFREYRKQQVEQIRATQDQLEHKIGTLHSEKTQKEELVSTQEQQKKALQDETNQTNQVVQTLKGKESEMLKQIEKNRRVANRVNNAISQIIEREMAKAAEEAEKKRAAEAKLHPANSATPIAGNTGTSPVKNNTHKAPKPAAEITLLTPEEMTLSENFAENQGKLYWPVDKGYITGQFGEHPHPLAPKVIINNYGIDIQSVENAPVRSVFDGIVSAVFSVQGSQQVVMITHGNYFTVYNNLTGVTIKKDDHVSAKQVIGHVGENDEDLPTINFQIWKYVGKKHVALNPESWISKAH